MKAHRLEQFPSRDAAAAAAGVTRNTWKRVEEGQEVRESTYAKVDKALGWAAGSCADVAEGGRPALVDESGIAAPASGRERLTEEGVRRAAFEAARAKLPTVAIGDIDAFSDEVVEILRRSGDLS
ncbi:hypothetical protein ACFCYB_00530 [Streptomyces sp. NPDC056309]|uniref:hypothetical protein n=1 Tax=Streptomyces sp. NPDC056309 TaxID=3345781 RepID=UPI0035DB4B10